MSNKPTYEELLREYEARKAKEANYKPRGGARPGSGRKPTGRKHYGYWITPEEDLILKDIIIQLRAEKKEGE